MDRCFDSGAKKKSARYTPAQCQKEMERQIGPDNALKEAQIRAYFSRRHAKLSKRGVIILKSPINIAHFLKSEGNPKYNL